MVKCQLLSWPYKVLFFFFFQKKSYYSFFGEYQLGRMEEESVRKPPYFQIKIKVKGRAKTTTLLIKNQEKKIKKGIHAPKKDFFPLSLVYSSQENHAQTAIKFKGWFHTHPFVPREIWTRTSGRNNHYQYIFESWRTETATFIPGCLLRYEG